MILSSFLRTIPISLEQGLAYGLVALGIVISFRILAFPDLTVDGSFTLGASVVARLIMEGAPPIVGILLAIVAGFLAGCCTGLLNTKLKINSLLAGILVMTILYSVNLRIMGRSNIQLLTVNTFLTPLENLHVNRFIPIISFFFVVSVGFKFLSDLFFHTQVGFAMRATGDNEQMIRTLGVDTDKMTVLGLGISNAFVALSGALVAQDQGFSDVGMGIGMIVAGLAAIIIGEALVGKQTVERMTLAAIVGSIIYKFIIAVGLRLGLAPTDLKMATGAMVILALGIPALKKEKEGKLHLRGV
ncbi:MAG: ABC transporter permease [Deltaproteobacteria bacterium]|nr:ABC transporter permease [Deltaproteobacteria bacterium]MBW1920387.1 ABC transporter permease [Deltaproteobacteria bacterium]MBW1936517.1 ABC transporter permease [Deltaproteobacteria bacterium]MBW1978767.1 ABC transporter permease [Deltaproteobacteria bacterium]MBW2045251.1 ABC transporter permease [Deltaproteobacteria bacterium]